MNGLTATIKAVNGEVRTLNFLLDDTGTKFEYIGGSFSDKGSAALPQTIAKLRKELANFEQNVIRQYNLVLLNLWQKLNLLLNLF